MSPKLSVKVDDVWHIGAIARDGDVGGTIALIIDKTRAVHVAYTDRDGCSWRTSCRDEGTAGTLQHALVNR